MDEQQEKVYPCITRKELLVLAEILKLHTESFSVCNPSDYDMIDSDGDKVGKVVYSADMEQFVFIPCGWEEEGDQ